MVIAIVKPDRNIESQVEEIMKGFDENLEVDIHQETCWCIGRQAAMDAEQTLAEKMGSWDDARDEFHKAYPNTPQEQWLNEYFKPRQAFLGSIIEHHPLKNNPDETCGNCNGTGLYETTRNPQSKWDWYVIGGRWDGVMCGLPEIDDGQGGFNFGDEYHTLERNYCRVDEVKITPFAIVTFDGTWIEKGAMGWWGIVTNEKDQQDWETQWERIKKAFGGYIAVSLDVHI